MKEKFVDLYGVNARVAYRVIVSGRDPACVFLWSSSVV